MNWRLFKFFVVTDKFSFACFMCVCLCVYLWLFQKVLVWVWMLAYAAIPKGI